MMAKGGSHRAGRREPELLDIKQAAALLQVSEASLRRWTNAGRLRSFRVGGRRERRFQRTDLLAFLEGPADHGEPGHVCGFYSSDLARARLAAAFLADGLAAGTPCFLASAPDVRDRVLPMLQRKRPSLEKDIEAGRLVYLEYDENPAAQIHLWQTRSEAAGGGKVALRAVGDVSGGPLAQHCTFDELVEYEAEFERAVARPFSVDTLCLYDARVLSGVEASRMFGTHADAFRYPVDRLVG